MASVTTATDPTVPLLGGHYHFLLRRLHSLTGIMFGGYLIVHLVVNATISRRGEYQIQVNKIHELAWLPVIEWIFIFLPIIFHLVYGLWIIVTGKPNNVSYPYSKNWLYLLQRISAIYIAGFLIFHVLSLKYGIFNAALGFDPLNAQATVVRHMHVSAVVAWVVYPLGVLASAFHTANGFWTGAVTWGLTISSGARRRWGVVCIVLFVLLLAAGLVAVFAAATQPVSLAMTPH